MNGVKDLMINEFKLKELGYDFMGYNFQKEKELSFHHLIIPKRDCNQLMIPNNGFEIWNGAILTQKTSHEFLHEIEIYDKDKFKEITKLMIQMNRLGYLSEDRIIKIHLILDEFIDEYSDQKTTRGKKLIKNRYIDTRHTF